jgi:hypothetical protein
MSLDLYSQAKNVITPGMGKKKLADLLGIKTPTARRLLERFRGETQGHCNDPVYRQVQRLKTAHRKWGPWRISQALGLTVDKAKLWLARYYRASNYRALNQPSHREADALAQAQPTRGKLRKVLEDGKSDVTYLGTKIRTLEDFLVYAEVDTKVWKVERFELNQWDVGMRGPDGCVLRSPLFQLKAWLRKCLVETMVRDVLSSMLTEFKTAAPERPSIPRDPKAKGLLEISILDLHLGKFASAAETGTAYNVDLCRQMFQTALEDLIAKTSHLKPAQILFSVGNDFYNTDSLAKTTTAGTPQDESVRWQESFVAGRVLIVEAIERLRKIAPVHVPIVSGNHDQQRAFYLGDALACWFSKTGDVVVDNSPALRKYFVFGRNLIGFCHGDSQGPPHAKLPLIMASEQRAAWARTDFHEWHVGHAHVKTRKVYLPCQDQDGVIVRVIPSLSPADAYLRSRGYQSKRAAEAFYFDPTAGCVAEFTHAA